MKVTSGVLGSHLGVGLLRTTALVALALGITLTFLLAARPVEADGPDSTTLVGNTGQAVSATDLMFNTDLAQPFTTGSNSSGYTLTSVELNLKNSGGTQAVYSVAIHANSSGEPAATSLGTLTTTTALTNTFSLVRFDASGSGISLDANKKYWVVVDVSTNSSTTSFRRTTSNAEDSGGATGWRIGNSHRWRHSGNTSWGTDTDKNPVHIRVNGSVKATDPPSVRDVPLVRQVQGAQNSTTLVSNTGQATGKELAVSADVAQPFTTGSEAGGYRLTGVQLLLGLKSGTAPGFSVSIHEDLSSGLPGSSLGALTLVGSLSNTASLVQFTASGIGIGLDAGKTYWVVLDTHLQTANPNFVTKVTKSLAEDTAAAGWSIGNIRRFRDLAADQWPAGNSYRNLSNFHPIIIQGHAKKDTILPANFDCNAYLGWEHTNGRQWDSADRVWRQVGSYYYTGQYANTGEPICERRFSSAGPGTYAEKLGYGLTLCSQAPTWQTVDPATGEAVGGPARVHKTGHLTSSGQEICSDFDGLRSTKKYIQEQQLKQLCSRDPTHALCN